MNAWDLGVILTLDGITSGAIYALLGIALVLVFSVTRIIFFGQGEFVTFGALTLAWLEAGQVPGTVWLLLAMALAAGALEAAQALREGRADRLPRLLAGYLAVPCAIAGLVVWAAPRELPMLLQILLSLLIVTPLGPLLYRLVYQPMAQASVLVLLIASVGVHFVLAGVALWLFGVEGHRTSALWEGGLELGNWSIGGQNLIVLGVTCALIVVLALVLGRSLYGMALRAAASNATGAKLLGIPVSFSGQASFGIAAFIGSLCGLLIAPIVTIYYDSGLLIGLKGFVAAIFGGMSSYVFTLVGAVAIGIVESVSSFHASAYKESIVFLLVIPILLWLSRHGHQEGH